MAAGTVTTTLTKVDTSGTNPSGSRCLTFTWVGASTDGTVPATAITANMARVLSGLSCVLCVTNPGTPAPTASYDVTLVDADGVDIMGGAAADRSATATEQARPAIATMAGKRLVDGILTFTIAAQSEVSAQGVAKFYFTK